MKDSALWERIQSFPLDNPIQRHRQNTFPAKVEVAKDETGFTLTPPKEGEWIIMQYKETETGKAITARLHYDTGKCAPCGNPEWRCACADAKQKK